MAELKINGKVKVLMEKQVFDSGFEKREFVITTNEQYPQDVKLEVTQQKTDLLDDIKEGEELDVSFNVRGNEYNGRYFVNLQAWKIEKKGTAVNSTPAAPAVAPENNNESLGEDDDDLPF